MAAIHYFANGGRGLPKEYVEVFSAGKTAILDNFRSLNVVNGIRRRHVKRFAQAKGFREEAGAFLNSLEKGSPPISYDSLFSTSEAVFASMRSLRHDSYESL